MKKRKISRILGVALTLALLTSMLIGVAPVSADVTQPVVTLDATETAIGTIDAGYAIRFQVNQELVAGDNITVTFPSDTAVVSVTGATGGNATIQASPGWVGGVWLDAVVSNGAFSSTSTTRTVKFMLGAGDRIGEGAEVRIKIDAGVNNPNAISTYTLTVATDAETTAVQSSAYSITTPTPSVLPGIIQVFNPANVLMDQFTGATAIAQAIVEATATGYVIKIGPGTYSEAPDTAVAGVTFMATGAAADTIVIGDWTVDQASTTISGLTLQGTVTSSAGAITTPVVIQNCVFAHTAVPAAENFVNVTGGFITIQDNTFDSSTGAVVDQAIIVDGGTPTITGNTFTIDATTTSDDTAIAAQTAVSTITISNNTITGASGLGFTTNIGSTATISGNTFSGLETAVMVNSIAAVTTVRGNAIQNGTVTTAATATTAEAQIDLVAAGVTLIEENDIENNGGYSIDITANADNVTVIGNFFSGNTFGLRNADTNTLVAVLNWWGSNSGPTIASNAAGTGDAVTEGTLGNVTYRPWAEAQTTEAATGAVTVVNGTYDQSTTVGISYTSTVVTPGITLARYMSNPTISAPPFAALTLGYYDVYSPTAGGTNTILFYNTDITQNTQAYYYSVLQQEWAPCSSQAVAGNNAYVIVTIGTVAGALTQPNNTELTGLPFVLCEVPPAPTLSITSPAAGVMGVTVKPTLVWSASTAAVSYQVQLAEDPTFATMAWSRSMSNNFYAIGMPLEYSTTYYWRVRAQTSTAEDMVGPWITGVFTTMAEPVEVAPPAVVEAEPPVVNVEVAAPVVTVEPTPVTGGGAAAIPDYLLWTIVIIGAVLIIALIVLIVRTRRVA
ncbi:beta strand repeat-containing protein [Chloroflexota bacterium]